MDKGLLEEKVIVISGGTKGIGKAIACAAVKEGANVVIGGRDLKAADQIVNELDRIRTNACSFEYIDLHHIADCEKLFGVAQKKYGRIDGFVNYAGISSAAALVECNEQLYDEIFDIDMKAAFFCIKNAILCMKKSGGGSIVIFGSPHAEIGEEDRTAYACAKGALLVLTRHVAKYYAKDNIRANYITMGWTPTEGELELRRRQGISKEELEKIAADMIPAGRMQTAEDHVPGILYLLSDYSSMVSGSELRITGGLFI